MPSTKETATLTKKKRLQIDYPRRNETITSPTYTFRIEAPPVEGDEFVEVAVDEAPPRQCRYDAGYWWYDWSDYTSSPHQIEARMRLSDGEVLSGSPRRFVVELDSAQDYPQEGAD